MSDTRQANPDDLDQLANLLEGGDRSSGTAAELASLFSRAGCLNASAEMAALRPLQTWLSETATELRSNAATLRGDPLLDLYSFGTGMKSSVMPVLAGSREMWGWIRRGELPGVPMGKSGMYMADYAFLGERPANFMGRMVTRGMSPRVAGILGGSHEAAALGGYMRNGAYFIPTAQQANLLRVGQGAYSTAVAQGSSRLSGFGSAMSNVGRASGALRGLGIAGSAFGTVTSAANLIQQGNPIDAFQRDPSGYTVDVTETAFNASMTAALIAPNPVTVGLAIGTGVAYGAALVWDNWDTITDPDTYINAANEVADFAGDAVNTVTDIGGDLIDGASDLVGGLF